MKKPVFWIIFLFILLAGSIGYLFLFFPKFQVQAVQVTGNHKIPTEEIRTLAFKDINKNIFGIGYKNIFTVDSALLKKNILASFTGIENIEVTKQWFEGVHLQITERKPVAVFCRKKSNQDCFLIDIHGVAFEPVYSIAGNLIVREDQLAMNENIMQAIIKIRDDLKNNFQVEVHEVLSSNPLVVTTSEAWQIHFDPTVALDPQITKMNLLLKGDITPAIRKNLKYIYLQYKDRAYYK